MIKTVLVTGGGGFIGSHLLELLLKKKYKVIVLERSSENIGRIEKLLPKIKVYFSNKNQLERVFEENKIDCVIHLAALYVKNHKGVVDVENTIDANVKFPAVLAELCLKHDVKYFINTGSIFEYKMSKNPIDENYPKEPLSIYATSKVATEEILKYYSRDLDLKIINLILSSPFGDGDNEKLFAFLIKNLISESVIDFSGGEQRWNFTYVKDIALAFLCALENIEKNKSYEDFNVGYDKTISIREIVSKLEKIAGKKLKINWGAKPYIRNEYFNLSCDSSKTKKVLKWRQKYDFDYGLKKTYDYYLNFYKKEQND